MARMIISNFFSFFSCAALELLLQSKKYIKVISKSQFFLKVNQSYTGLYDLLLQSKLLKLNFDAMFESKKK